jgi:hypothetical protein
MKVGDTFMVKGCQGSFGVVTHVTTGGPTNLYVTYDYGIDDRGYPIRITGCIAADEVFPIPKEEYETYTRFRAWSPEQAAWRDAHGYGIPSVKA